LKRGKAPRKKAALGGVLGKEVKKKQSRKSSGGLGGLQALTSVVVLGEGRRGGDHCVPKKQKKGGKQPSTVGEAEVWSDKPQTSSPHWGQGEEDNVENDGSTSSRATITKSGGAVCATGGLEDESRSPRKSRFH